MCSRKQNKKAKAKTLSCCGHLHQEDGLPVNGWFGVETDGTTHTRGYEKVCYSHKEILGSGPELGRSCVI
jgi:hypothetical protein